MNETELLKNVYVDDTVTCFIEQPDKWLDGRDEFSVQYVGGIHNLSRHDKTQWARGGPVRIIEVETEREEVWFPKNHAGAPIYISLDRDGTITSHLKYDRQLPAFSTQRRFAQLDLWYTEGQIGRSDGKDFLPTVQSTELVIDIQEEGTCDYLESIQFKVLSEFWEDGEWKTSQASGIKLVFTNPELNTPKTQDKALKWITDHCKDGFFPLGTQLFGSKEEEFMFVADICS